MQRKSRADKLLAVLTCTLVVGSSRYSSQCLSSSDFIPWINLPHLTIGNFLTSQPCIPKRLATTAITLGARQQHFVINDFALRIEIEGTYAAGARFGITGVHPSVSFWARKDGSSIGKEMKILRRGLTIRILNFCTPSGNDSWRKTGW